MDISSTPASTFVRRYSLPYTAAQDERLVLCWIEVSKLFRSKPGPNNQDDFWATLTVVYSHANMLSGGKDTTSLRTRWEKIEQDTLKFSRYYYELKRQEGAETEKSVMKSAAARFVELDERPFEFEFLWSFHLRYQPKWMEGGKAAEGQSDAAAAAAADVPATSGLGESAIDSRHSSTTVLSQQDAPHHQGAHTSSGASNLGNTAGVPSSGSPLTSRKEAPATSPVRAVMTESQRNKKMKKMPPPTTTMSNQERMLDAMAGWNEQVASNNALDLTSAEQERERIRIDARRLRLEQDSLDRSIIDKDLALLPDELARQFYRLKKKAILEKLSLAHTPKPAPSSAAVPSPPPAVASSSLISLF
ncbi:hypothetical protein PGT21_014343 [Puccinia graminis f. sp. tritici]|uniref:No apical meristem-associated C-terminal domain-containing protein n=1 Tax=Puccinia graminis f. sp. tritici TaxID=56615 RepID=A0A5B0NAZ9_PUCGR|nr:hypothetical protein PGT21_014343 [Puccinia graminis f. sp. tritici]KAA1136077.1 hypothetical protein PGTUg99_026882 [Puccinia graminis f. sp. tritici]